MARGHHPGVLRNRQPQGTWKAEALIRHPEQTNAPSWNHPGKDLPKPLIDSQVILENSMMWLEILSVKFGVRCQLGG